MSIITQINPDFLLHLQSIIRGRPVCRDRLKILTMDLQGVIVDITKSNEELRMKKYTVLFSVFFLFFFNTIFASFSKTCVELGGGFVALQFTDLENSVNGQLAQSLISEGYTMTNNFATPQYPLNITAVWINEIWGNCIGLTLGYDYYTTAKPYIDYNYPSSAGGNKFLEIAGNFPFNDFALGLRYYLLKPSDTNKLNLWIGAAVDMGIMSGASETVKNYDQNENLVGSSVAEFNATFPIGAQVQIGINYWFTDLFGLYLNIGDKYLQDEFPWNNGITSGTFASMQSTTGEDNINFGGVFCIAGVTLNFE